VRLRKLEGQKVCVVAATVVVKADDETIPIEKMMRVCFYQQLKIAVMVLVSRVSASQ